MLLKPYQPTEISYAWCYRVYFRWQTHRLSPQPRLRELTCNALNELLSPYDIHLLELTTDNIDMRLLASLQPSESVSTAASKIKGRLSHTLNDIRHFKEPQKLLARGYFASTAGPSTASAVEKYLEKQGDHHGYSDRARPPVFVRTFEMNPEAKGRLQTDHASTLIRFHIVMSTWHRHGVFVASSAELVSDQWHSIQTEGRFFIEKVSFVPDHVHVAVRLHPTVAPAEVVVSMMNAAQQLMWDQCSESVIRADVDRLWQPSAYIGSYGDLTSNAVSAYVRKFERV
jgi:REP element-mobilizing transposase RayT